jgi:cell division protein FtsB
MATTVEIQYEELIDLRRERTLFRTLHRKARGREDRLKTEVGQLRRDGKKFKRESEQHAADLTKKIKGLQRELRRQGRDLGGQIAVLRAEVEELEAENEELKATVARQARRLYGRSTEQSGDRHSAQHPAEDPPGRPKEDRAPDEEQPRSRGQQPGAEGHGRRPRPELPTVETVHDVPVRERSCPICGEPYYESSLTEDSSQVEVQVVVRRHIHRRKRYFQACHCGGVPFWVVAPKPGKIIPRGLLHHSVWTYILLEKWLHQRPVGRVLDVLALKGLDISQGTARRWAEAHPSDAATHLPTDHGAESIG